MATSVAANSVLLLCVSQKYIDISDVYCVVFRTAILLFAPFIALHQHKGRSLSTVNTDTI